MTIEWQPEINQNMAVIISLSSKENISNYYFQEYLPDNSGKFIVPKEILQNFKTGIIDLLIRRGNYKLGKAPDGKTYGTFLYTQNSIAVILEE